MVSCIILPNQFGFIKGRLASDCVNLMDWKCFSGAMALKVDIQWDFIWQVLRSYVFLKPFVSGFLLSSVCPDFQF